MKFLIQLLFPLVVVAHPPASDTKILYEVPLVSQSTDYSCGAASLLSILKFYGEDNLRESDIMKEAATDPVNGTEHTKLVEVSIKHGVPAEVKTNLKIEDIENELKAGRPVIVELQAWGKATPRPASFKEIWDEGHYAVVIAINKDLIYFMDPVPVGSRVFLPVSEFLDRWHDVGPNEVKMHHTAIFFTGTPKPPPQWEKME